MSLFKRKEKNLVEYYSRGIADGAELVERCKQAKTFGEYFAIIAERELIVNVCDLGYYRTIAAQTFTDGLLFQAERKNCAAIWLPDDGSHVKVYEPSQCVSFFAMRNDLEKAFKTEISYPLNNFEYRNGVFIDGKLYYEE